ncbi:MAG: ABC transporter substrate-binding protein [Haliea sp.]|nr:MAG: ABC transporter substrate-binding protein [Haliea sp.]
MAIQAAPVRVAVVSYLNARPLVQGLRRSLGEEVELVLDIPSRLPALLASGAVDLALLPVAALPGIPGARVVADYGIAADGPVASVSLFSQVPMEQIEEVVLDDQSCTSVALARLLLRDYWRRPVRLVQAQPGYLDTLAGPRAGVIIGDRALGEGDRFAFHWDLAAAWKEWTGLPFVFAAWAGVRAFPQGFMERFNAANEAGLAAIDEVVAAHAGAPYDVATYFRDRLRFRLDARMHQGLALFLEKLPSLPTLP